jgi:predicted transposase YbfD/YdcC
LEVVRAHWEVEMAHWALDVTFREDASRIRKAHGPQNFARLRRFALNLLKRETTTSHSLKTKRQHAAWDPDYRRLVLAPLL